MTARESEERLQDGEELIKVPKPMVTDATEYLGLLAARKRADGAETEAEHIEFLADRLETCAAIQGDGGD